MENWRIDLSRAEVRRLGQLGPKDPSKRDFLGYLIGGISAIAGGSLLIKLIRDSPNKPKYEIVNFQGQEYLVIDGNDTFFRLGHDLPEPGRGYIAMRQRHIGGSNGPTTLDHVIRKINGGDPKQGQASIVPVGVVTQEEQSSLYERIRLASKLTRYTR